MNFDYKTRGKDIKTLKLLQCTLLYIGKHVPKTKMSRKVPSPCGVKEIGT